MSTIISEPVVLGILGGLALNMLNLAELQNVPKERRPDMHSILYWLPFVVWPLLGGIIAYIYNDPKAPLGKVVAFHLGLASPAVLRTMATVLPALVKQQLPPNA